MMLGKYKCVLYLYIYTSTLSVYIYRLGDAIFVLDGCEHILDDTGGSGSGGGGGSDAGINGHAIQGFKLHSILSRILTCCMSYAGCIVLLCHVDNPHHVQLQRDFASNIFIFIRFVECLYILQ